MNNKIIAVVKFNNGEAFVLEKKPELKYTKYGNVIIGTNSCFLSCYYYEKPIFPINPNWSGWQAFGGRKFDLHLTDGTVEHCFGQWWGGITEKTKRIIGEDIIDVTVNDVENLKKCYVFSGYTGIKKEIEKLRAEYTGNIYEYKEYEKILKEKK